MFPVGLAPFVNSKGCDHSLNNKPSLALICKVYLELSGSFTILKL